MPLSLMTSGCPWHAHLFKVQMDKGSSTPKQRYFFANMKKENWADTPNSVPHGPVTEKMTSSNNSQENLLSSTS